MAVALYLPVITRARGQVAGVRKLAQQKGIALFIDPGKRGKFIDVNPQLVMKSLGNVYTEQR